MARRDVRLGSGAGGVETPRDPTDGFQGLARLRSTRTGRDFTLGFPWSRQWDN